MQNIKNPRQTELYDPFERLLAPLARRHLEEGWQGVFRRVILERMPAEEMARRFHPILGRPTKELYSMAGLVFIQQFMNWTAKQAAYAYMFDLGVQFALNLEPAMQRLCDRTLERYQRVVREDGLAGDIYEDVTEAVVTELELSVDEQRLDSAHVFSDMAVLGRTQLMGVVVKRFLTQVLRHDPQAYEGLPEDLRRRYAPSAGRLFGDTAKYTSSRKGLRQTVAQDMYALLKRFADDAAHNQRTTYKNLERVFNEQCEVVEERVEIEEKAGSRVMQNPSDPDATFDGCKGPGHQVQLSETCSEENDVQVVVAAIPQTAADTDPESYPTVQEALDQSGRLPQRMRADAAYGSDTNVEMASEAGVELVSPVNASKRDPEKLHAGDFAIDPATETVTACPAGHAPLHSVYEPAKGRTRTRFNPQNCQGCPLRPRCPVTGKKGRTYYHTPAQRRAEERLRKEKSPEFRKIYAKRAGIEGTIARIRRCVGLHRLRVRGRPAVHAALYLKIAGWNLSQAAKATAMRKRAERAAQKASERPSVAPDAGVTVIQAAHGAIFALTAATRRTVAALKPMNRTALQP